MNIRTLTLLLAALVAMPSHADWEKIKSAASQLGDAVGEAGKEAWQNVTDFSKATWASVSSWAASTYNQAGEWSEQSVAKSKAWLVVADQKLDEMTEPKTAEQARSALDTMADTALVRLFNERPSAKLLFDQAYGYAVFDSRKFALMLNTSQGAGVAVSRHDGARTYMKMFGAGMGAGLGGKFYQQVILFENRETFERFVSKGWEASSEVGAVAGQKRSALTAQYNGGMAIYQQDDKGLLLDASITGSKYWVDRDLTP
ncbi:YSC84-related protein [Aeromonas simiae]|uniref:Ysc84 actin-binding domain-containing protein n=1 Tax=Aeromonas simiae TaxID=218936 RepID=A0A5J6WYD4_9GAMM|nr:YSC84-related protein [Aeromonas simiae]QFI54325.1 hypothetical protein FE240_06215 [Aeromonas simiae]